MINDTYPLARGSCNNDINTVIASFLPPTDFIVYSLLYFITSNISSNITRIIFTLMIYTLHI